MLSSPGAQNTEGSLQTVSSSVEPLGVQPFPTWGAFPFIVQGGAPIYIYLALCLGTVGVPFVPVSHRGPLGRSGVGRLDPGDLLGQRVVQVLSHPRPVEAAWSVGWPLGGLPPVLSAWVYVPCLQGLPLPPLRSPCQQDGTLGEGCLIEVRPGVSGHTRWRNGVVRRGNHHYGEGGDVR